MTTHSELHQCYGTVMLQ